MTQLLSFLNVTAGYSDGDTEVLVLGGIFLNLCARVSMGLYGPRGAGKTTLLRLAAGLDLADSGSVLFEGRDLAAMTAAERRWLRRGAIAFMSCENWRPPRGESVLDHVSAGLLGEGVSARQARMRAHRALEQVEFSQGAAGPTRGLSQAGCSRVMLARALVQDEPAVTPSLGDRDRFYALLRSTTGERGISLLAASEEIAALHGFGVLASIAGGELCSTEPQGVVLPFSAPAGKSAQPSASGGGEQG
jgi:putative ABC transport system ATP-binding protein